MAVIQHLLHFLGAAVAAWIVAMIPRFEVMYHDLLEPGPLPSSTLLVLRLQPLWMVLAIVFALAALYLLWRWRLNPVPGGTSFAMIVLPAMQAVLVFVALFLPIAGTIIRQKPPDAANQLIR